MPKREITTTNERRRTESVRKGFLRLGELLPSSSDEKNKLSKSSILKQSVDYIRHLKQENSRLSFYPYAIKKLRKILDGPDEWIADEDINVLQENESKSEENETSMLKRQNLMLRFRLERERKYRVRLVEHVINLENRRAKQQWEMKQLRLLKDKMSFKNIQTGE